MQIAVIGVGRVGATLGRRWAQAGHGVTFGVRDPRAARAQEAVASAGGSARAVAVRAAVADADVVVLAVPWAAAESVVRDLGDLDGRVLVDCTNPLLEDLSGLSLGHSTSAAEQIATWATDAKVVKAFNCTGSANMADPGYPEGAATMFVCGDDPPSIRMVRDLARDLGFEVVDAGSLARARLLEPLAMLWINLAYAQGMGPDIAFRLMTR